MLILLQCNIETNRITVTQKFHPNDPFQETIVPSQTFDIDAKKDNVIEGENGTIIVIPKGCFKNSNGETVTTNVKIELAEALTLDKMVLSNLTTTFDGNLLETDGMIYLNVTSNGEQLTIDKDNPVYIEIPTDSKKPGMMAYKGVRNEKGDMNWIEPQELETFLVTVDIDLLNFYPDEFEEEVIASLPFRNHKTATNELIDSLYYSLSASDGSDLIDGLLDTDFNETYYNYNNDVIDDGEDTIATDIFTFDNVECGIDPAIIKVIKSEKFQNTLISTREFELRLQYIFKTCQNNIIEIYIKNPDKNLWELDSLAAEKLREHELYDDFYDFYKQGLTNVEGANKYADILRGYYEQKLSQIKFELKAASEALMNELQKKNKVTQKLADDYKELIRKREKHRMETYGFEWTETGWVNIDRGIEPKDWGSERLEIIVENGKNYDRVYTYVVYTSINSLYRLNSTENEIFYVGNEQQREMLMPKKQLAVGISIAYIDEMPFLAIKEFETGSDLNISLSLEQSTMQKISESIKTYDKYKQENRIDKDLEYMALFAKEEKRQKKLKSESEFIRRLWEIANPCCVRNLSIDDIKFESF